MDKTVEEFDKKNNIEKLEVEPIEFTDEMLKEMETVDSSTFKANFEKMYEVTDQIVSKILAEGRDLKEDSYVVREEFGEALAAGYRYLKLQTKVGKQTREANHPEDNTEERDYETEMYKEFADVFMMTTSFCRHNEWKFENKPFIIVRPIEMSIEEYLVKASEVLYRIALHYNGHEINEDYIYEFLEETYTMISSKDTTILQNKIDKFYNKIKKVVE